MTRPSEGWLRHADGSTTPLRFVETSEVGAFLAVTRDGERVTPQLGDRVRIDVIGPGQSVVFRDSKTEKS